MRGWVGALTVALTVGLLPAAQVTSAQDAVASDKGPDLPKLRQPPAVSVSEVRTGGTKRPADAAAGKWRAPKVEWPAAGRASVEVVETAEEASWRKAATLPVSLGAAGGMGRRGPGLPGRVEVVVADRKAARAAGVDGVLLTLRGAGGKAPERTRVRVDYGPFRGAYGGDWAARLRLVELPACAATTPEQAECRVGTPLPTANDSEAGTVTATVSLAGAQTRARAGSATVLGLTAGDAGPTGTYKATSLQASGEWNVGGPTGGFSWNHPIAVPGVPGGLQPGVSLGYSSQSVDGKTSASNSQPSWIGDGWNYEPGFIERRYKACNDDKTGGTNTTKVGDLCWFNDNATLSLGGKSTELVYDAAKGWHPASDTGEKIEKLTNTDNDDNNNEYWKVTTNDGTQYFFGRHQLPGWSNNGTAKDDPVTNSVWTVPVFGNQAGEPCYNASFANGWCQQAWRWQLDYVVDRRGNAMAYYWNKETNNYGRNVSDTTGKSTVTPYDRGGYLDRIEYGLRADSVYTRKAMAQVAFTVDQRCLTNCGTFDEANAKNWPDVPFDQYCKPGSTECKQQYSPTFWSQMRLKAITTKVLTGGAYQEVDSWALLQSFPPSGDGISTPMWLSSITRTGKAGGTAATPAVRFEGVQKFNRVDKLGDGLAPFVRLRMSQIITETGGVIGVDYLDPGCTDTTLPPADGTNTTRCYPVKWAFEGDTAKLDWFHSYPVRRIIEGDNLAATPDTVTEYTYVGNAAWSKSTDEFTKSEDRTHSIARGYHLVQTRKGTGSDARTLSEARYFRGVDGAEVKNSAGVAVTDREQFAGMLREQATYNGDGGALVSATSHTPWRSTATASRARPGLPNLEAYYTGTQAEETRTAVSGGTRTTKVTRAFDAYGMVTQVSGQGDIAKTGDESCTTTSYVRNTDPNVWILNTVSRAETLAVTCEATPVRPRDVTDDVRTAYDGGAVGAVPTKGLVSASERIQGDGSGYDPFSTVPATCGTAGNQLCFDDYGRALKATDPYGKVTSTTYTPAAGEPPTSTVSTNPLGHSTTTVSDPLRGQPTKVTDANGKVTTTAYDALGRISKVWTPTRSAVDFPNAPNHVFEYAIRNDAPSVVTTKYLDHNSDYQTSYAFYDGLLRPVQTQERSPSRTGRLMSETYYNTRGEAWLTSGAYYATGNPEPVLAFGQQTAYPAATETRYDGAGRPVVTIAKKFGDETKRSTTAYTGDTTTVTPPQGGTTTTTVVDALGRTVETQEHTGPTPSPRQSVKYAYDPHGRLQKLTDQSGAVWTYGYDTRGRQTNVDDPDKGASTTTYDHGDRPVTATDARGITLTTTYDALGRKTAVKKGASTLSAWTYDTVAKGQPATSTRHVDGKAYVSEVTSYTALYQPEMEQITIPGENGEPADTYVWSHFFTDNTSQPWATDQPAISDLPAETVTTAYNTAGLVHSVSAGSNPLISSTTYDHYGRASRLTYGPFGRQLFITNEFDDHTGNLTRTYTDRTTAPQRIEDTTYGYDPAGNVKQIAAAYGQDTTRTTDTQCFTLDPLRRITQAWTNTGTTCAAAPSTAAVGGEDPYWTSYTYDAVGNRKTETQHKTPGGPAADIVRTYAAPEAGKHNLPKVTHGAAADPRDETFAYDAAGNTTSRKIGTAEAQSLAWDDEGRLKSVTQGTKVSSYAYDISGARFIRKDSTGTTLYLPGGNELHIDASGLRKGTRYYGVGGKNVAMRTGGQLSFLLTDPNNTATTQVTTDTTQNVTRRKTTIFGAPRGTQPANWRGDKGFVGGTIDADTGLTQLGARQYDPLIGRFISVDPLLQTNVPQTLNGYTYGAQNPLINPDPSGLGVPECHTGVITGCQNGVPADGYKYSEERDQRNACDMCFIEALVTYVAPKKPGGNSGGGDKDAVDRFRAIFTKETLNNITSPVKQLGGAYSNLYNCVTADGTCGDLWDDVVRNQPLVAGYLAITGLGERAEEITDDLQNGRHAEAMAKISADVLAAALARKVGSKPKGSKCSSFAAGTLVLMSDGTTKAIEDLKPGDKVLATDPETGRTFVKEVTATPSSEGTKNLVTITTESDEASEQKKPTITATGTHPFWVPSLDRWVDATELQPGQRLRTSSGTHIQIAAIDRRIEQERVHNLTIADIHTYYVLAGQTPVLVHNSNGLCGTAALENGDWQHIVDRHRPGGALVDDAAGIFTGKAKHVRQRIADTINRGTPKPNTPDPVTGEARPGQIYEWDFGTPVGRAGPANGGGELTGVRVIVNDGKVVTAFPY